MHWSIYAADRTDIIEIATINDHFEISMCWSEFKIITLQIGCYRSPRLKAKTFQCRIMIVRYCLFDPWDEFLTAMQMFVSTGSRAFPLLSTPMVP